MASAVAPATDRSVALQRASELVLPLGAIACVLVILVPLPAPLLDLLLVASITMAVIVLLTTIYVRTPLEFSIFPSLLLAATLARLVLNVATTRLILTQAQTGDPRAAGGVIQTFGDFVTRGNIVVGLIIFAIVVLVQFVVITKGATRISEVAARFALDGLPGRQMSIDADLSAGVIDNKEAELRRQTLHNQADFFGAMDGASKFVRGDAVAGLVITLVNIVGGLVIGIGQAGMGPVEAGQLYTKLTIGDGLASQIPALLISMGAGLLVTRNNDGSHLPTEFNRQLFSRPQSLAVAGVFLGLLVFTSLPRLPLIFLALVCLGAAYLLHGKQKEAAQKTGENETPPQESRVEELLSVDPLEVEVGLGLIRLADRERGGDLLTQIQRIRQEVAAHLGILMPKVRVRDNMRLRPNQFRIRISENIVAQDTTSDSVTIATQLDDCVRRHADEILTRDATQYLIDQLAQTHPVVVKELIPSKLTLGELQQVLQVLLRERVPIRQLGQILEALGDYADRIKEPVVLAEYVRQRLARTICAQYRDRNKLLQVVTLDSDLEQNIRANMNESDRGIVVRISHDEIQEFCRELHSSLGSLTQHGRPPVLLVSPEIRAAVRQLTASKLPDLAVLSYNEITQETQLESMNVVRMGEPALV